MVLRYSLEFFSYILRLYYSALRPKIAECQQNKSLIVSKRAFSLQKIYHFDDGVITRPEVNVKKIEFQPIAPRSAQNE